MTIACEGGLPLRLLQQENAHLTQFFRTVLDSYYRTGQGDIDAAILIARQQAHRLPRSLRHEAVFHLTGSLIAKISELQQLVGEAADPVVALDTKLPDWRRDLPLQLDDQVAETLLIGLVRRSGELAQETATGTLARRAEGNRNRLAGGKTAGFAGTPDRRPNRGMNRFTGNESVALAVVAAHADRGRNRSLVDTAGRRWPVRPVRSGVVASGWSHIDWRGAPAVAPG